MTVGVYGLVAGIVKLDDLGLHLSARSSSGGAGARPRASCASAPWLMKALSVAGTAAMFLVGGGILTHGIPPLHHAVEELTHALPGFAAALVPTLIDAARRDRRGRARARGGHPREEGAPEARCDCHVVGVPGAQSGASLD